MPKINKKTFVMIFLSLGIISLYTIQSHSPILISWVQGKARILGKPIPSTIFINDNKVDEAKIFEQKSNFDNSEKTDYLILFVPDKKDRGITVLVVDKGNHDIKTVNSTRDYYDVIFGYLFQSESGSITMFSVNHDMKGIMKTDPDLKITSDSIEFNLSNAWRYKIKVSIKL